MIRVYFMFEDPSDEVGLNLSYVDVPTRNATRAFDQVERAASSGELWARMYPDQEYHPYKLVREKMMYIDITGVRQEWTPETVLRV